MLAEFFGRLGRNPDSYCRTGGTKRKIVTKKEATANAGKTRTRGLLLRRGQGRGSLLGGGDSETAMPGCVCFFNLSYSAFLSLVFLSFISVLLSFFI